ncbi:hypothetical protein COY95_03540, partial [Candidatus Woesearchaeota archaeon CG_4_10_14_0_8_um_filter_47_5]
IAGANEEEVKTLISKQGKFEAKILNNTVFKGGQDVTDVCRKAECSGIDPRAGCGQVSEDVWSCRFFFTIGLSQEAADRQAKETQNLNVITEGGDRFLNESLDLYLDNEKVDTLRIGAELKGRATRDIQISGSGTGNNQQNAVSDALNNMKRLQTILITGSLPTTLSIVKTDSISPTLGNEFIENAILVSLVAILGVALVILIRYRRIVVAVPILIIVWLEVFLVVVVTSLVGQRLDIASIAGIIVAVGTGVDDQIVITDEILKGEKEDYYNWVQKLKKAFFIVIASYATTMASMIPLLFAGAGLLKGFAITTMIGVTIGVTITRPAFAKIIEILL